MSAVNILSSARHGSGLRQRVIADRSGVASSSLSQIEHGRRDPTLGTLETILTATGRRLVVVPTTLSDAADISADIHHALTRDDDALARRRFIQLSDNLASQDGATTVALTLSERPDR